MEISTPFGWTPSWLGLRHWEAKLAWSWQQSGGAAGTLEQGGSSGWSKVKDDFRLGLMLHRVTLHVVYPAGCLVVEYMKIERKIKSARSMFNKMFGKLPVGAQQCLLRLQTSDGSVTWRSVLLLSWDVVKTN